MTEPWIIALAITGGGVILGAAAGFFVRRRLLRSQPAAATEALAGAAGLFTFWLVALTALLVATSLVRPESLRTLPRQLLDYTPRLLAAGLILLGGYAIAGAAARLVAFAFEQASGRAVVRAGRIVRWTLLVAAGVLALAQLGVDTTILLVLVAVFGSSLGLAAAILVGFGGRDIAREIAAGRYVGRFLEVDSIVTIDSTPRTVVALHPATVEFASETGTTHVPYSRLMDSGFSTNR